MISKINEWHYLSSADLTVPRCLVLLQFSIKISGNAIARYMEFIAYEIVIASSCSFVDSTRTLEFFDEIMI